MALKRCFSILKQANIAEVFAGVVAAGSLKGAA